MKYVYLTNGLFMPLVIETSQGAILSGFADGDNRRVYKKDILSIGTLKELQQFKQERFNNTNTTMKSKYTIITLNNPIAMMDKEGAMIIPNNVKVDIVDIDHIFKTYTLGYKDIIGKAPIHTTKGKIEQVLKPLYYHTLT